MKLLPAVTLALLGMALMTSCVDSETREAQRIKYEAVRTDPVVTELSIPGAAAGEVVAVAGGGTGPGRSPARASRDITLPADVDRNAVLVSSVAQLKGFGVRLVSVSCFGEPIITGYKKVADLNARVLVGLQGQELQARLSVDPGAVAGWSLPPFELEIDESCPEALKTAARS